ncbi:hypothetical protein [Tunicatimonas pelagia]|uniref:hypothetical protein n=1 Tax=Tunicatimonas pelagia TaxID=931531 RepID=UPI00266674DD|nr:hypothetical protein [Tunicatimonas pelagia]WKN40679.1 hypothetical protein P0M28_16695 [Tunicatimonas pelagia]
MKRLILTQIENYKNQIVLMNFIFSLLNVLSLLFLAMVFEKIMTENPTDDDVFIKYIQALAALLAPYLAFVAKGYFFPLWRKLDTLFHLYFNKSYSEEELKIIYDKD